MIYRILLSEEIRSRTINSLLNILRTTAYYGINIMISGINEINQNLYIELLTELSDLLKREGYLVYVTVNPEIRYYDSEVEFSRLDYAGISRSVDRITFFQYIWGPYVGPPAPVSSISLLRDFIEQIVNTVPPDKISIGKPLIGYDWQLPYVHGATSAYSMSVNSAMTLASVMNAAIQFDETSQTPYFQYIQSYVGSPIQHLVWFIDARSINILNNLIIEYNLAGSGIWNIMIFYQLMWTIINAQINIIKLIPDNLT